MDITKEKLELIKQNLYEYTEEEINELYRMTVHMVKKYVSKKENIFDDLVQHAITDFLGGVIQKYDSEKYGEFSGFVFGSLKKSIIKQLSGSHSSYVLLFDDPLHEDNKNLNLYNTPSTYNTPSEEYEVRLDKALENELFEVVKSVPILNDYYFNGLKQSEIANKFNMSEGIVRIKINEELGKIRENFNLTTLVLQEREINEKKLILKNVYNISAQIVEKICQDPILIDYYIENLSKEEIAFNLDCSYKHAGSKIEKSLEDIFDQCQSNEDEVYDESKIQINFDELKQKLTIYKHFLTFPYKLAYEDCEIMQNNAFLYDYFIKGLTGDQMKEKYHLSKNQLNFNITKKSQDFICKLKFLKDVYMDEKLKEIFDTLNSKTIDAIQTYKLNYNDLQKLKEDPILNDYFINDRSQGEIGKEIGMAGSNLSVLIKKKMQKIKEETEQDYKEI